MYIGSSGVMNTYIAILRGINVAGARKLPMKELRDLFATLDCRTIRTYIQSGNVIFEKVKIDPKAFAKTVEHRIEKQYGYDVPVIVISAHELEQTYMGNPFLKDPDIAIDELHVTFLGALPAKQAIATIPTGQAGNDQFTIFGNTVFVYCPDGYGRTKLNNNFFEKKLNVRATTRNWKTVGELVRMSKA